MGAAVPSDPISALWAVVEATNEYLGLRERERSHRHELDAYQALETERIKTAERVLTDYFDKVFSERRENFAELWSRLDVAAAAGDSSQVAQIMHGIVELAKSSPLSDLGELPKLREALNDPNHVWDL